MPLSAAVRERCQAFLPPDEEIHYVFPATSVSVGGLVGMANFIIVVTSTEVVVLACDWFKRHHPDSVWARHPRTTRLGPLDISLAQTFTAQTFTVGDLVLEVDEEYAAVIMAADAELSGADESPLDPFPDL
jgi:hypothetical protein